MFAVDRLLSIRESVDDHMNQELLTALINNAALLLALSIVCEISFQLPKRFKKYESVIIGLLISAICVVIMSTRFVMAPGLIFDTRTILISVAALFFGPIPTAMTVATASVYRIVEGGIGLIAGLATIVTSALTGYLWNRFIISRQKKRRWLSLYLMSVTVHLVMILCMFLMPYPTGIEVAREIALPVLLVYPVASLLLSLLIMVQKDRNEAVAGQLEAESRYLSLFKNHHTVMMLLDPSDGRILDANPAATHYYGWTHDELTAMRISDINTLGDAEIKQEMARAVRESRIYFVFKHRHKDGTVSDVEVYSGPIQYGERKLLYSIVHDISSRIKTQRLLSESEERFRSVVESAPEAIFIQTGESFVYVNPEAVKLFGADSAGQLIGLSIFDRFHPDFHDLIRGRLEKMKVQQQPSPSIEEVFIRMDGSEISVDVSAVPVVFGARDSILVFCRDITARKMAEQEKLQIEAQLRQQQKLDAIGLLAGGVAHEINNPINGIMNYAQLVLEETPENTPQADWLQGIIHETKRVSEIVRNLLQFSRQDKQTHSYARIEDIVNQTVSLVSSIFRKDQIEIAVEIPPDLPSVKCRSQQIQQVLLNLLTNARDALNEKYPGYHEDKIIRLNVTAFERDGRRWIRMTVEDHGTGIADGDLPHIFEPFYSTKPKESGTGLGLSISFGIVRDHHGYFEIDSQKQRYTRIHCILPVDNGWTTPSIRED